MATRDDVARLAGVSSSTVSYAISGRRRISDETRDRVFAAMRELDYTPNAFAQGLAGSRKGILALNYPLKDEGWTPIEVRYFETATATAHELGFHLLLWPNAAHDLTTLSALVAQQLVDGVIMMEVEWDDPRVALFAERGVRFVLLGRTADPSGLAYVDTDFGAAARTALEYLVDRGHRDILFVAEDRVAEGHGPMVRTADELEATARRFGVTLTTFAGPRSHATGRAAYRALAASGAPTTAAIVFNEPATIGLVHAAQLGGRSIPGDLSLVSIGMGEDAAELDPPLTTITPPVSALTDAAVRMLVAMVEGHPLPRNAVLLEAPIVERDSVRSVG
ncbi:LacI family DNA-binding transcriptional regulator [Propionicimonas sp.]|uniref:LacI family DNA-binding transcriptional regulator n=1 Tax=Propionicimonas sp. TaxID=1955623 RepID=UPI0039E5C7EA